MNFLHLNFSFMVLFLTLFNSALSISSFDLLPSGTILDLRHNTVGLNLSNICKVYKIEATKKLFVLCSSGKKFENVEIQRALLKYAYPYYQNVIGYWQPPAPNTGMAFCIGLCKR